MAAGSMRKDKTGNVVVDKEFISCEKMESGQLLMIYRC
jgi:hypothetical protein